MGQCCRTRVGRRTRRIAAALLAICIATACSTIPETVEPDVAPATTAADSLVGESPNPTTSAPADTTSAAEPDTNTAPTANEMCNGSDPNDTGPLPRPELDEISGLVRATTLGGFWMHTDGGDAPGVWALGDDLADRGFTSIAAEGIWDFEDMAISHSGEWPTLIVADIGDNRRRRETVRLVAIDEPFPGDETSTLLWDLSFRYPDGPRDAEALLVDDEGGYLVIVTKEEIGIDDTDSFRALPARIYQTPLPSPTDPASEQIRELAFVGEIDTLTLASQSWPTRLHPLGLFGRAASVTAGDVTPSGRVIGIRTYGSIWLWDRPPDMLVSEALLGEPCEAPAAFEIQGESFAFVGDTDWATVGEGRSAEVNVTRQD